MANSTSHLDLVSSSQAQKEVTVNAALDAASPAMLYGRRASTSAALTWGYYGGVVSISGTPTQLANGTVTLTASATNYVEANPATGAVSANTTGFTAGRLPLYQVVAGASTVTSYTDLRVFGADAIAAHEAASDPHAQYQKESERGAANGYASLDSGGKLPVTQLPDLAVIDFLGTAANQAAMLALSGQKGDWCARSDTSTVYVITGPDPTQIGSWTALSYPTGTGGTVTSVALTTPGLLFDVAGSPVTGAGTLAMSLKTQVANRFLAGPASGVDAAPTMRSITQADLPAQPFDVHAFYPGIPAASAKVTRIPIARAVTFPTNFAGSYFTASVGAAGTTVFDVQKNGASIGSISIAAGGMTATFTTAGGTAKSFAAGDVLMILAPGTPDATLADIGLVLAGTR